MCFLSWFMTPSFISGVTGRTVSGQSFQFSLRGRDWSGGVDCFPREGGRRLCQGFARKEKRAFNRNTKVIIQKSKTPLPSLNGKLQLLLIVIQTSSCGKSAGSCEIWSFVFPTLVRQSHFMESNVNTVGSRRR